MSVKTGAALKARDVDLGTALYSLIDSEAVPHGSRWPFLRVNGTGDAAIPRQRASASACCNAQQQAYQALIGSLSLGGPPGRLLPCLPFRNWISISAPLTRTSSHRR
jgi:hypothetical protein